MTRKSCRSLLRIAATAFRLRCYRTSSTRSLPPRWGAPREAWASASRSLEASSRRWGDGSKCRPRSAAARPSWWPCLAMRRSSPHASDPKGSSLIMSDVARILIADDEETFLQSMGALLRREGYACDCVRDAREAAAALEQAAYDLLITDIYMPGNAELEFLSELQSRGSIIPVIVVTGYPSVATAVEALRLSVEDYAGQTMDVCALVRCPRLEAYETALRGTIEVLRKTKNAFKSKELAALRERLEEFLKKDHR